MGTRGEIWSEVWIRLGMGVEEGVGEQQCLDEQASFNGSIADAGTRGQAGSHVGKADVSEHPIVTGSVMCRTDAIYLCRVGSKIK